MTGREDWERLQQKPEQKGPCYQLKLILDLEEEFIYILYQQTTNRTSKSCQFGISRKIIKSHNDNFSPGVGVLNTVLLDWMAI